MRPRLELDPKRLVALARLGLTCEQIALALALESGIVASAFDGVRSSSRTSGGEVMSCAKRVSQRIGRERNQKRWQADCRRAEEREAERARLAARLREVTDPNERVAIWARLAMLGAP